MTGSRRARVWVASGSSSTPPREPSLTEWSEDIVLTWAFDISSVCLSHDYGRLQAFTDWYNRVLSANAERRLRNHFKIFLRFANGNRIMGLFGSYGQMPWSILKKCWLCIYIFVSTWAFSVSSACVWLLVSRLSSELTYEPTWYKVEQRICQDFTPPVCKCWTSFSQSWKNILTDSL